jgi:hypothetical protein
MSRAVAFAISTMRKLMVANCATSGGASYLPVVANRSLVERAMQRTREHLHNAPGGDSSTRQPSTP